MRMLDRIALRLLAVAWRLAGQSRRLKYGIAPSLRTLTYSQIRRALENGSIRPQDGWLIPRVMGAAGDYIGFNEGRQQVEKQGHPATVYFRLSTKPTQGSGTFAASDTFAGGFGEITGTGYAEASQARPTPSGLGQMAFTQMSWATGSATDWGSPKSIVCVDKSGGGGSEKLVCAWDLVAGGAARDMSQVNTTLNVTPTYAPTNP